MIAVLHRKSEVGEVQKFVVELEKGAVVRDSTIISRRVHMIYLASLILEGDERLLPLIKEKSRLFQKIFFKYVFDKKDSV